MVERAAEYGIDPAKIEATPKPMLMRVIVDPEVDITDANTLRELNTSSDQPIGKTKDPLSEAATKAAQFREAHGALEHFAATADVDPEFVLETVGTRPRETYAALRDHSAVAKFRWLDQDVQRGQPPNVIEESSNAEGPSRLFVPEGTEGEGSPNPGIFGNRGSRGDGGRGDEASEGGARRGSEPTPGVHPLAPTAQGSEQLPSAGTFQEGTATEAPKSTAIVRDLQKVLHEAFEGVKVAEGKIPKRGMFARALAVVDPRTQVVRSVSLSDVPAIGHEYGHLMQKLLFGATAKGGIDNAQLATLPGAVRGELEEESSKTESPSQPNSRKTPPETFTHLLTQPPSPAPIAPNA